MVSDPMQGFTQEFLLGGGRRYLEMGSNTAACFYIDSYGW